MTPAPTMPPLTLVVAMDEQRLIGAGGGLPWRLPEDLKHFRRITLGHIVLMGRRTWDSLGKPLDGRDNWVLSRDEGFRPAGARVFATLNEALRAAGTRELMVIGGAQLFAETLPRARRIELTEVHARLAGDTWFPEFDRGAWREVQRERREPDPRHAHAISFVTLERTLAGR
ncbi:MAG TPA: dihydrofolate reductase [Candidatus Binatia bacterium]|nr:dihydrofolate reductase [Candidatus Binatia bacterium]